MLTVLGLALAGCDAPAPTAPMVAAPYPPGVRGLVVESPWVEGDGIFHVRARLVDDNQDWPVEQYVEVTVTSSAGEREVVRLSRAVCGLDGVSYLCGSFLYRLKPGVSDEAFGVAARKFGVRRFSLGYPRIGFSGAYVFGDLEAVLNVVRTMPEVEEIRLNRYFPQDVLPYLSVTNAQFLAGARPFCSCAPTPADGVVSARTGDTLVVAFVQPSGDTLKLTMLR